MIDSEKEAVLEAWIKMMVAIDAQRVTSELPFNEAVVCNYLKNHQDEKVTAAKLCQSIKMQKSLMNRTLDNLESKGLIYRQNIEGDRRKKQVCLVEDFDNIYFRQHEMIMQYIEKIADNMQTCFGNSSLSDIVLTFDSITKAINNLND